MCFNLRTRAVQLTRNDRVIFDNWKKIKKSFCVCFSGIHLLRPGCPQSRLRHDLLWSGQRRLFVAIRLDNEIRRSTAVDGTGRYRSRLPRGRSSHVEASP